MYNQFNALINVLLSYCSVQMAIPYVQNASLECTIVVQLVAMN